LALRFKLFSKTVSELLGNNVLVIREMDNRPNLNRTKNHYGITLFSPSSDLIILVRSDLGVDPLISG
jgi:hypothetical protein